ncbi:MAG: ATP-dependent helicase/nuclease subunit [Bryobacterales bacterium]|nr:ATP-dependent helicase/nuclease subunit [Bryobacterales bacterium]
MPEFTAAQNEAIQYRKMDACVEAGPGSGKTTVLVERYRRLIEDHNFGVHQILAITFTEKAAANMKAKVAEKFSHDALRLRELESAWVSTVHGFCARLLRENAIAAGIDPRFRVLDARESDEMQIECLNSALDELVESRREDALALIEVLQSPLSFTGDLKNTYDGIRSAGMTVEQVRPMPNPSQAATPADLANRLNWLVHAWPATLTPVQRTQRGDLLAWIPMLAAAHTGSLAAVRALVKDNPINLGRVPMDHRPDLKAFREQELKQLIVSATDAHTAPFRELIFDVLSRFDALYNQRKTEAGALDFNDLERRSIELLRRDKPVQDRVKRQFRQIMLDEFQDINEQQAELIRLIRDDDVFFAVGDVNQSIYGFRHAQPAIFNKYRAEIRESGKHLSQLLDNFRSRADILSCVEALLNASEGIEPRELVARAQFHEKAESSIEVLRSADPDKDEAGIREAKWIAYRILQLRSKPAMENFGDFAVLCRNGESMKPILEEFDRVNIPYVCGRRQSFLLSRDGRDITALLHVIANPRDGIALGTVLRSPLVGLSDEALLRLRLAGNSLTGGLKAPVPDLAPDDAGRVARFNRNLKRWRASCNIIPLDVLITRALSDCGVHWIPGSLIGANIEAFLHLARSKGSQRSLLDFLRELESVEGAINTESDLSDTDQGDCVQVMTAHAAKGLEFPVTIIAAMNKETQRSSASIAFTAEHGLGIKWKDPVGVDGLKDSWALANSENLKQREREEASRLLYVAMTRAEQHLILSYSASKRKPAGWARWVDDHFGEVESKETDPPQLTADAAAARISTEVPVLSRPTIEDQHDTAVNVTSLALFAKCPRKYYIQRYLGWTTGRRAHFDPEAPVPDDDGDEVSAAELGSLVHDLLAAKPGEYPDEAHALANVFLQSELGRRAASATRSEREWDFIADIGGTVVRGSVDLWFEENGEIVLVDYKTDATPIHPDDYAPQLAIYALALERALGVRPARAYLHFLRPNRIIEVPLDQARDLIAELRDAQDSLHFDLNEGDHCKQCPYYRSPCPAGLSIQ